MFFISATYSMNAVYGPLIANMAAKGIAGIGRVGDQSTHVDNLHNRRNAAWLWVLWMDFDNSSHARIVGTYLQDARPENPVSCRSFES